MHTPQTSQRPHATKHMFLWVLATLAVSVLLLPAWAGPLPRAEAAAGTERERVLGERTLQLGAWGADVFALQRKLVSLGYAIQADGTFGKSTRQAVIAFQRANGLKADGIAGPVTIAAIQKATPPSNPAAQNGSSVYTVQPGDSLWTIAQRFHTTVSQLRTTNGLTTDLIQIGQILRIP